jgi:predicted nucleic acid-binding protein
MRVFVDSSVWVDHLRGARTRETAVFDAVLAFLDPKRKQDDRQAGVSLLVGDLVLCEVLRGIPDHREHAAVRAIMLSFELVAVGGVDLALRAADHYRALRRLGITVRKTIDLLIGTYCIAQDCDLLHSDRDFDPMTEHLGLRTL